MQQQQHLNEEQLIELFYSGTGDRAGDLVNAQVHDAQAHLDGCKACSDDYKELRAVLAMVSELPVPERGDGYGREIYARLLPRLEEQEIERSAAARWSWLNPFRSNWAGATAMAMLLVMAFFAGSAWQSGLLFPRQKIIIDLAPTQPVKERVLLVALGDHLDRSQMVLMEVTHAQSTPGRKSGADISNQQQYAEDLIADNRLYRQTAWQTGDKGIAGVLEELERMLMEIANSPSHLNGKQLDDLQKRIEDKGILFKVRVIGSTVRDKQKSSAPATATGQGKL